MNANARMPMPRSPGAWVDLTGCVCGAEYRRYNARTTWADGVDRVRLYNGDSGGFRSRGPVLWARRVLKAEAWYQDHQVCDTFHVPQAEPTTTTEQPIMTNLTCYNSGQSIPCVLPSILDGLRLGTIRLGSRPGQFAIAKSVAVSKDDEAMRLHRKQAHEANVKVLTSSGLGAILQAATWKDAKASQESWVVLGKATSSAVAVPVVVAVPQPLPSKPSKPAKPSKAPPVAQVAPVPGPSKAPAVVAVVQPATKVAAEEGLTVAVTADVLRALASQSGAELVGVRLAGVTFRAL